mmetsp:Transcript_25499/g.79838  ORF Transcript_25499/g.79838 Transcript_25499/m.79838 type:complete len:235 (-) Transcript_25499:221-925(-)
MPSAQARRRPAKRSRAQADENVRVRFEILAFCSLTSLSICSSTLCCLRTHAAMSSSPSSGMEMGLNCSARRRGFSTSTMICMSRARATWWRPYSSRPALQWSPSRTSRWMPMVPGACALNRGQTPSMYISPSTSNSMVEVRYLMDAAKSCRSAMDRNETSRTRSFSFSLREVMCICAATTFEARSSMRLMYSSEMFSVFLSEFDVSEDTTRRFSTGSSTIFFRSLRPRKPAMST